VVEFGKKVTIKSSFVTLCMAKPSVFHVYLLIYFAGY